MACPALERRVALATVERALFGQTTSPTVLGRYLVHEELGRGGFSIVYRGFDPQLQRPVAIKLLRRDAATEARLDRRPADSHTEVSGPHVWYAEAQALARVEHPNVVPIFDVGMTDDAVCLIMQQVPGRTLEAWIEDGPRGWSRLRPVMLQAAAGLEAVHELGLVHRDFKPENALVSRAGALALIDFGLAQPHESNRTQADALPPAGRVAALSGTLAYMAPEQYRGQPATPRSDQYAFCVVLFEALQGRLPFDGQTIRIQERQKAQGLRDMDLTSLPIEIRRVLQRGLDPNPVARFPSMRALARALEDKPDRLRPGLAAGLTVVVVAATLALTKTSPHPCRTLLAEGDLAETWAATKDTARTGFSRTGLAYAPHTWSAVEAGMDQHVHAWMRTRDTVCQWPNSPERAASVRCLADARNDTSALLAVLAVPDSSTVKHAPDAVAALAQAAQCREHSNARPPLTGADAQRTRAELRTADALLNAGRHEDAVTTAKAAMTRASATGDDGLISEALLLFGAGQMELDHRDSARRHLSEAVWTASAAGHDRVAARAATRLVTLEGPLEERLDSAQIWSRHANAAVQRAHDPTLRAGLESSLGALRFREGNFSEARAHYQTSADVWTESKGPTHPGVATAHTGIGSVLAVRGDLKGAVASFEHAVEILETTHGPEHPTLATALHNLGLVQGMLTDARLGRDALLRAIDIQKAAGRTEHASLANALTAYAVRFEARRDPESALAKLRRALTIFEDIRPQDHAEIANARFNLGWVLHAEGRLDEAREHYRAAVDMHERLFGPQAWQLRKPLEELAEVEFARGNAGESKRLEQWLGTVDGGRPA